jgi:cell division protein FtsB
MSVQFRDELLVAQVNAIKELSTKNDALEARIAALEA